MVTIVTDELLTPEQLAEFLGVKLSTIYKWVHIGYLPTVKLRKLVRFKKCSIIQWLEKSERPGRRQRRVEIDLEGL